ncbi:MAG: DNA replication/repair protein RecF [Litorilituus sp.]|jgi:DNA replication and repair protein RecF|nr:DNA replication/repair protein RecF [Litorilituus sp.]
MAVARLITQNFRNLQGNTIDFNSKLNFFIGDNGSGKSSLLEALFFLGHGKSFRTTKVESLVCYHQCKFVLSVKDDKNCQLGLSKELDTGNTLIKIDGQRRHRLSDLAKNIAIQIITPESFKLFFGGPKERRRFVDLGMFHVKHQFSDQWREFSRVLKQRNACIRNKVDDATLTYWTDLLCQHSQNVSILRREYTENLFTELKQWLNILLPSVNENISVQFTQGWPLKKELCQVYLDNKEKELQFGYSLYGAHKFDVKFMLSKQPLESHLSRGQQKLFLLALTFAQSSLMARVKRIKPILLIDDIGAELDENSRATLSTAIERLNCQVIVTAIEKSVIYPLIQQRSVEEYNMFHVKHGEVLPAKWNPADSDNVSEKVQ